MGEIKPLVAVELLVAEGEPGKVKGTTSPWWVDVVDPSRGSEGRPTPPPWIDAVIEGDALAVLEVLPTESVQLAITSPPYNVGIDYAGYSDDRRHAEYLSWLRTVWKALHRVLVVGGRFALNVAPTSIKDFRPIHHDLTTDLRNLGYILRTEIIWYKQTMGRRTAWGSWRSPSNPHVVPSWEYVLVFSKGRWKLDGRREDIDISSAEFQTYSDGFWKIPPERHRKGHPAPFPEELIERLVKFYSYRGNVVLDMFGGTGTVAAVARRTGRHFVHIDVSPSYCDQAMSRISAARPPRRGPSIPAPARRALGDLLLPTEARSPAGGGAAPDPDGLSGGIEKPPAELLRREL